MLNRDYLVKFQIPENFVKHLTKITILSERRNSSIFLVELKIPNRYVLKRYKYDIYNSRDRLKSEVEALLFFKKIDLKNVPHLIYYDQRLNFIIMNYINGKKIEKIEKYHIDKAVYFLDKINKNRHRAKDLMNAAENCFNLKVLFNVIVQRYNLLNRYGVDMAHIGLFEFLREIDVFYDKLKKFLEQRYSTLYKCILNKKLDKQELILSPSDFGFHNALEKKDEVIFLDFEYFGWDDAAKLIGDFLLHPGMELSFDLKRYFVKKTIEIFEFVPYIKERIKIYYPFLGVNWILRILNEFLPDKIKKREENLEVQRKIQKIQFEKAVFLLKKIKKEYNFPYL